MQQDYKITQSQCLHLETSKRSIKSLEKIGQFFEELKFNQEPREAIFVFCKIHFFSNIPHKEYLY